MIVAAFMISWVLEKPIEVKPLLISKLNTLVQLIFAALVLSVKAFDFPMGAWFDMSLYVVAALALASIGAYLAHWIRHMSV